MIHSTPLRVILLAPSRVEGSQTEGPIRQNLSGRAERSEG